MSSNIKALLLLLSCEKEGRAYAEGIESCDGLY